MTAQIPRICIYSAAETADQIDQHALSAGGYEVVSAASAKDVEAWAKACSEQAVLIVVQASAEEGMQYCRKLRNAYPLLPVILVARECSLPMVRQAAEIGLVDFLELPVRSSALLHSVQQGLSRQRDWREWKRFAQVLSALHDGVILTDLTGHLRLVNPSARDIFPPDEEPFEGKPVRLVFHHPDLLDLFNPQISFPHRSEITTEDGRVFSAQASLIPDTGVAVVLQEITYLKELDRIKSEFVNTVSHDIRSPLTSIYGFVGLIDKVGPVNEQQADFIRHIQTSVQHITELINDLMELSRVEANYDIEMEDVDLGQIINRSLVDLDYQVSEKMHELDVSLPEQLPAVQGNPLHLQRMVTNLIENAIKFTPPLGKISIQCRTEGNQLIFQVTDNGLGIPLPDQPRVFEKFFRGSNLTNNTPGTGLGLSIVKSIIDRHHGRIWLESSPSGTTFTVILPLK